MGVVTLSTLEDVLNFLDDESGDSDLVDILFEGELRKLLVSIEGADFSGEITGEIARALASYQDAIYNFAKVVLRGDASAPYTRLTNEERKKFQVSISVEEGCTLLKLDMQEVLSAVASQVKTMDSKQFVKLVLFSALIGTTGVCIYALGGKYLDVHNQASQRDHVEEVLKTSADAQNKQLETLLDRLSPAIEKDDQSRAIVSSLASAQAVGMVELAKAAPTADSIEFGEARLSQEDIAAINSRAPRTASEPLDVTARFRVKAETTEGKVTKVTFFGAGLPAELTAEFVDSDFSDAQANAMWEAIRNREPVTVQLRGSYLRGAIRGGVLVDIFEEDAVAATSQSASR